jgi:hypothetical protein
MFHLGRLKTGLFCLALCLGWLLWLVPGAGAKPLRGWPEADPDGPAAPSFFQRMISAAKDTLFQADDTPNSTPVLYQVYGENMVFPLNRDLGLKGGAGYATTSPAWELLRAAWPGASLLPLDRLSLGGGYEVFLAVMTSDLNGRPLSVPQQASFISAQQRGEVKGEVLQDALALLSPKINSWLGVLHRDDYSLMVLSARLDPSVTAANPASPGAVPEGAVPGGAAPEGAAPRVTAPMVMASSLSLVKGVPIVIGLSTAQATDILLLGNLCQSLTLYLQLSNQLPEGGFFNPKLDNLVIAGRKLSLRLPAGQCLLTGEHPRSLAMLLQLEAISRGALIPLLAYAPCQSMEAWLEEEGTAKLDSYGALAINLEDGQLNVRDGITTSQFAQSLAAEQAADRRLELAQLDQSSWDELLDAMPEGAWEELGHLGADERAGYWAILVKGNSDQGVFPLATNQACIMAGGMVNNLVITSVLYAPLTASNPYSSLLEVQRQLFKDLN